MKKIILFIIPVVFALSDSAQAENCQQADEPYFLFGSEAKTQLDSLEEERSDDVFSMGVLATNIAFSNKDKKATLKGFKYLTQSLKNDASDLISAYWWVNQILSVVDSIPLSKKILIKIHLASIPKCSRLRISQAYDSLTAIRYRNQTDTIIQLLFVSTTLELTEHSPLLFEKCQSSLDYLSQVITDADTTRAFFLELLRAQYYYYATKQKKYTNSERLASRHLKTAEALAICHYQQQQVKYWGKKIN